MNAVTSLSWAVDARGWYDHAACNSSAGRALIEESFQTVKRLPEPTLEQLRDLCRGCPVVTDCFLDVMDFEQRRVSSGRYGFVAGLTPEERAECTPGFRDGRLALLLRIDDDSRPIPAIWAAAIGLLDQRARELGLLLSEHPSVRIMTPLASVWVGAPVTPAPRLVAAEAGDSDG